MSTKMASSMCVGTSTLSHQSAPIVGHSQQQLVIENNSMDASSNADEKNNERRSSNVKNDVAVVADMDLVNSPNPWLPAYGFQLQQHSQHFQPTHEDSRANDPALAQQGDFLETILEETSDDLQSDSDRSGTTYWLGSDSETESVIHIKANQRTAEERRDGSGSECNSVIPKKRRRKNASKDRDATMNLAEENWTSSRSSRSSESSSRSSSLIQFESLERTCATVSPSGYSYDSLEYTNRPNSHFANTSPDSLDEDCGNDDDDDDKCRNSRSNGFSTNTKNGFGNLRPYRSFESLDTHKNDIVTSNELSNGFSASFYSKTSNDLSADGLKNNQGQREFWHDNYEEEEYDYEEEEDDDDDDVDDDEDTMVNRESRSYDRYEKHVGNIGLLSFTDCNSPSYSTSLDFRNAIDLREIGLETKREAVYDLKSGQASSLCGLGNSASSRLLQTTRLNIAGIEDSCGVRAGRSGGNMASSGSLNGSGSLLQHHRHHHHHDEHPHHSHHRLQQNQRGWSSDSLGFNFRFTDKSRSAPSLPSDIEQSTSRSDAFAVSRRSSDYYPSIGTVSSTSLFENYTRVASVPVDLNLCGREEESPEIPNNDEEEDETITNDDVDDTRGLRIHEMADDSISSERSSYESGSKGSERTDSSMSSSSNSASLQRDSSEESSDTIGNACVRTSSVRTQIRPEIMRVKSDVDRGSDCRSSTKIDTENVAKMNLDVGDIGIPSVETEEKTKEEEDEVADEDTIVEDVEARSVSRDSELPRSTVKTQDRESSVLEMAMAMENDIDAVVDEAIRQFKREVEEATGAGGNSSAIQRLASGKDQQRPVRRVKNNASYELAQQFEIDENTFVRTGRMTSCSEDAGETASPSSPGSAARRRVLNNASYELAQQSDYIKLLQKNARPFQRMDACDERTEVPRPDVNCAIKVADLVREMSKVPSTSRNKSCPITNDETIADEKNIDKISSTNLVQAGRYQDNHANAAVKNFDTPEQQQESIIGQIKKNSDPFSLYGEGGKVIVGAVGSVEGENDDEIDYPCLEIKSIIDNSDIIDVDGDSRPVRTGRNDDNEAFDRLKENESLAERGLSFIGDFYPEMKNHLARGTNCVEKSSEREKYDANETIESVADDGSVKCVRTIEARRNEKTGHETAGPQRVVVHKQSPFSSPSSSPSSASSPCKSDRSDWKERGPVNSIESVAQEPTVSVMLVAAEEKEEKKEEEEEEEASSSTNDLVLEKEKEAKRRKECAYVETGKASPNNRAASSAHAVTPATSSPPRSITKQSVCVDGTYERNGQDTPDECATESLMVKRQEDYKNNEVNRRTETKEELEEEVNNELEKIDDTKKAAINNAEMSATAAKRLAMASGPPRNNNEHSSSSLTMKNDIGQQKKSVVLGSPVNERKKGGLGGFLQRFSRLRFSGRSKVPRSEINKKITAGTTSVVVVGGDTITSNERTGGGKFMDEQPGTTRRKEPDYIIIPLHGPGDEHRKAGQQDERDGEMRNKPRRSTDLERSASCASPNGRPLVSSKPPLPPGHHQQSGGSGGGGSGGGGARNSGATTPAPRCGSAGIAVNTRRRAATDLGSPAAIEMAKARAMQAAQEPRPVGLLETDLDAAEPAIRHSNLSNVNGASANGHPVSSASHITASSNQSGKKTRSLLNLNHTSGRHGRDIHHHLNNENELRVPHSPGSGGRNNSEQDHHNSVDNQRPHKSMEFLLDKENLHFVKPPENELQKVGERVPSEHELRVQRSLQRLNVPDWYKNSPAARDGFRLKRHSDASQHSGWRSLGSKTTSLSSLSSSSNRQPTTGVLLSPSPTPPVFSRWSTSLLNSAGSSPANSARSSFNHRQPYLGWRSQERLAHPRTPAERLAQGILPQLQSTKKQQQQQQQTNQQLEVRNSIKEVTSAIVHYVQSGQEVAGGGRLSPRPRPDDWDDRGGARSTSPRGSVKLCWMESSFVGSRPVDSPETPMSLATDTECCAGCNATGTESCSCVDSVISGLYLDLTPTRDEPQQLQHIGQQQKQIHHGSRSQCASPSSTLNYHQPIQHHQHGHQQQQQQQHRHHRGELLLA